MQLVAFRRSSCESVGLIVNHAYSLKFTIEAPAKAVQLPASALLLRNPTGKDVFERILKLPFFLLKLYVYPVNYPFFFFFCAPFSKPRCFIISKTFFNLYINFACSQASHVFSKVYLSAIYLYCDPAPKKSKTASLCEDASVFKYVRLSAAYKLVFSVAYFVCGTVCCAGVPVAIHIFE